MNARRDDTKAGVRFLFVVLLMAISAATNATAQDETITNAAQFAGIFDQPGLSYPLVNVAEAAMFIPTYDMLWVDFWQLTKAVGDVRSYRGQTQYGITTWPLRITRSATGTTITYPWYDIELLQLPAPAKDDFSARYAASFRTWCILTGKNYTSYKDLIEQGYSFLDPPNLVIDLYVADVNDYQTYAANCAAEQTEAEEASAQITSASRSMLSAGMDMLSEESESFDVAAASYQTNFCQGIPVTAISQTTTNIRLNWVSVTNDTYAVQYANNMEWFNTWHLIGDNLTSASSNAVWEDTGILSSNVTKRFYRVVRKDGSYGLPCVTIISPTNAATVSGTVPVGVYATDDSRISSVALLVDGQIVGTLTDGPMVLPVNTVRYTNGIHTIQAVAYDNQGSANLGGDSDSDVVGNSTSSETLQIQFSNPITLRWFDSFGSQLPIHADLPHTNADWSIVIRTEAGALVKTLTGTTSNAAIDVTWDATDTNGTTVADHTLYSFTITEAESGGGGFSILSFGPTNRTQIASWRERPTSGRVTLLARQKLKLCCLPPSRFLWEGVSAAKLLAINTAIASSDANTEVYGSTPFVIQADSDWTTVTNVLVSPDTGQFYYNGHSLGNAIGYGEFTPSKGLTSAQVSGALSNTVSIPPGGTNYVARFRKPLKFVFIDGCRSGTGDWPLAFGIFQFRLQYSNLGLNNRAFLGWTEDLQSNIYGNAHDIFSRRFWERWTEDTNRELDAAILLAAAASSSIDTNKLVKYGFLGLTWSE